MTYRRFRRHPRTGLVLGLLAVLVACGQGGGDTAGDTGTADADTGGFGTDAAFAAPADDLFKGRRIAVLGSNPWPIVGDLLTVGVTPIAILGQEGNDGMPAYLADAHPEASEIEFIRQNLWEPNLERLVALDADLWVMPDFFRPLLLENEEAIAAAGGADAFLGVAVDDWTASITALATSAGVDPEALLAPLERRYGERLEAIRSSLDYDPAQVEVNTFQWNDAEVMPGWAGSPLPEVLVELGFVLHPSIGDDPEPRSLEVIDDLDADLVFIQPGPGRDFDELVGDPLWSSTSASSSGNTFERFQYGQQGGWLEMEELLHQLEDVLPRYTP